MWSDRLVVLGCSKLKADKAMPAIDLYHGALFKKGKQLAQMTGVRRS